MHAEAPHYALADERDRWGPAVALALGLHSLVLLLIVLSSWLDWNTDSGEPAAGSPAVEASLSMSAADIRAAEQLLRDAPKPLPQPVDETAEEETVPPPQPIEEPRPQDSPTPQQQLAQERIPVPDTEDQEEASRLAISQEKAKQEQEAKRRQEQIDLTERQRQQEAENKQRLAAQQEEADKQKKLAEIRRQRAELDRQKNLAEQKLRQIAEARAQSASSANAAQYGAAANSPAAGEGGVDEGLLAKYRAAIQSAVSAQWTRPETVPLGTRCRVVIKQLPGGQVMSAEVQPGCAMDQAGQDSLERAVLKAQPLPYRGFESVFNRTLIFNFTAQDH
ncbi:cell envelope integrity protein TolA [Pseudoxanthomonas sacheonensis]|uniref:cell envelope integrity protein TolA n=1 Tax=Pseudoxanthomonas sacheonensis TaxID=443615 RepID=UPI0013D77422|nr:cell envelope integrity protein TolA [Pseudoxanthomonas sacheonensis]KAF1708640.1 protein TolA [Pseudoxanthomonas sacheonensis]